MNDIQYLERIEAYLGGELSPEEHDAFEKELAENPDLKEEYDAYLLSLEVIDQMTFKNLMQKAAAHEKKREARRFTISRRMLAVAACILLILGIGSFWYAGQNYSNQAVFAQHFQFPNTDNLIRGEDGEESEPVSIFREALWAYENQDLTKAVNLLASISEEAPNYNMAQYYLGNLYLESRRPKEATAAFEAFLSSPENRYAEDSEWGLILAYLQKGEMETVNARLEKILTQPDHFHYDDARTLKRKLGSFWRRLRW